MLFVEQLKAVEPEVADLCRQLRFLHERLVILGGAGDILSSEIWRVFEKLRGVHEEIIRRQESDKLAN